MATPRGISWILKLPKSPWRWVRREPIESVQLRVGDGVSTIVAGVRSDGQVSLTFGTGEEFRGSPRDLPYPVAGAARRVIADAGSVWEELCDGDDEPERPQFQTVGFTVRTRAGSCRAGATIADLRSGLSPLAPLWQGFADLLGPMVTTLFVPPGRNPAASASPGIVRAHRLWVSARSRGH